MWIKTNDTVKVISGEDRGTTAKVVRVNRKAGKLVVEGVNRVYKHVRRSQKESAGRPVVEGDADRREQRVARVREVRLGDAAGHPLSGERRERTLLQEMRRGQRPGVPAEGQLRKEITRNEHERSQSEKDGGGRTARTTRGDSHPAVDGKV